MINHKQPASRLIPGFLWQINLWAPISIGVLIIVIFLSPQERLLKLNHLIQDLVIANQERDPTGDIIIVAIDDKSIAALGRWPWRRAVHAELLDRIGADNPKAIGLDVLFTEPDLTHHNDDTLLAASIKRNGPVVLPVFIQSFGARHQIMTPLAPIAEHAAGLGQPHLKVDNDGVVRSTYLLAQADGQTLHQLSKVLLDVDGDNSTSSALSATHSTDASPVLWQQQNLMTIPYAGPVGHFERISYIDVIRGVLPKGTFSNKYVLIGATATSVGDQYATPATDNSVLMPGVEILANVTDAMVTGITLQPASDTQNAIFNLLFVSISLIGFMLLSPFFALLLTILLALTSVLGTFYLAGFTGILFAPSAGILGLSAIYPLWSWHRLNTVTRFLMVEYESLQQGRHIPFTANKPLARDFLDRRIAALEGARQQLQNLHLFILTSLDKLPYPTIISDTDGFIRFANQSAAQHFNISDTELLLNRYFPALIADVRPNEYEPALITDKFITNDLHTVESEARDNQGRDLILKCVPIMNADKLHVGWILSLIDISALRQAERDREEAFRFITHDIRAPLSSIIALLELSRLQNTETNEPLMLQLEQYADNALELADDFMNLSRAKSAEYRMEEVDLCDLLSEVADEVWASCRVRNIHLKTTFIETPAYTMVDRQLFKRAITNLVINAIKFSPDDTEIICSISGKNDHWDIAVIDHGIGIAPELQAGLFDPFNRIHAISHPGIKGTGLGLAIVQTIIKRHGGNIEVQSKPGSGSAFHILIPVFVPANQDNTDAEQTADAI
ncbi:MAG: histidine kinase [Betaproteobacteria bacterium HGW-Betaproteobacteria-8]|jgi:signal transduction histidine kinase|nr:MAG: histidine kinase [Betaproteobacteria bacterium HGW-Betaproteobacteria-8]PKO92534.1 MAG: histidine kinase [Betaproteobacteria bacterium HGW-Betaproteobacteria-1]